MLSRLEISAGVPLPDGARRELESTRATPRDALLAAMLPALQRPPCVVSFSGGRDSSLVLALAVAAAAAEGLPGPVPVTVSLPGDAGTDEHVWQEVVVRHLGLTDWERIELSDEFDCVGPLAQAMLQRHGVLWPPNVHFHDPQLRRAEGGSLLTGVGGDEIFSTHGWDRLHALRTFHVRPERRDALRAVGALSPLAVRRVVARRRAGSIALPWLRPEARRKVLHALADGAAAEPVGWAARFAWLLGFRDLRLGAESLQLLADDHDVSVHHPLLDPAFAASLAALRSSERFRDRTDALLRLFPGDLLPETAKRASKAVFTETLWGERSRDLAASWDGDGVDRELVDVDMLARRWREGIPGPHTLLQSIWLAVS